MNIGWPQTLSCTIEGNLNGLKKRKECINGSCLGLNVLSKHRVSWQHRRDGAGSLVRSRRDGEMSLGRQIPAKSRTKSRHLIVTSRLERRSLPLPPPHTSTDRQWRHTFVTFQKFPQGQDINYLEANIQIWTIRKTNWDLWTLFKRSILRLSIYRIRSEEGDGWW